MQTLTPISKVVTWFHLIGVRHVYRPIDAGSWQLSRYAEGEPVRTAVVSTRYVRERLASARKAFTSGALVEREAVR